MAENDSNLAFGRVLEGKSSDRKVWFLVIPLVLGLGALLVFAGLAIAKTGGLESKVELAEQQALEAQKAVEERDALLRKARSDEAVLRSPGQGAAVMAAAQADSPASGVALVHPEQSAVKLFVFGLERPEAGQEYRVEAVAKERGERTTLGVIVPDDKGTGFLLAKNLPEGATGVEVVLAKAQAKPDAEGDAAGEATGAAGDAAAADASASQAAAAAEAPAGESTLILAGLFPAPGTAGVVAAPDVQAQAAQARTPARSRRPLR